MICSRLITLSRYAKNYNTRNTIHLLKPLYFDLVESKHNNYYSNLSVSKSSDYKNSHTFTYSVRYYAKGKNKKIEKGLLNYTNICELCIYLKFRQN